MRIVTGLSANEQSASLHDVVPSQRYKHRMFDIVIEGVAISNAFKRQPGRGWDKLREPRMRGAEPAAHIRGEERTQRLRGQFGDRNHNHHADQRLRSWAPASIFSNI